MRHQRSIYLVFGVLVGLGLGFFLFPLGQPTSETSLITDRAESDQSTLGAGSLPAGENRGKAPRVKNSERLQPTADTVMIDRSLAQRIPGFFLKPDLSVDLVELEKFGFSHEQGSEFEAIAKDLLYRSIAREKDASVLISEGNGEVTLMIPGNEPNSSSLRNETMLRLESIQSANGLRMSDVGANVLDDITGGFGGRDRLVQYREDDAGEEMFEILELTQDVLKALKPGDTAFSEYKSAAWKTTQFKGGNLPESLKHLFIER